MKIREFKRFEKTSIGRITKNINEIEKVILFMYIRGDITLKESDYYYKHVSEFVYNYFDNIEKFLMKEEIKKNNPEV